MSDDNKYYTILGLKEGASQIEIKNAYKNLTKLYHPDIKETGSTEKMQEINMAYKILFNQESYNQEIEELKKNPEKYQETRANFPIIFEEETEDSDNILDNTPIKQDTSTNKHDKTETIFKIVGSCCIGIIIFAILLLILPFSLLEIGVIVLILIVVWCLYKKLN